MNLGEDIFNALKFFFFVAATTALVIGLGIGFSIAVGFL